MVRNGTKRHECGDKGLARHDDKIRLGDLFRHTRRGLGRLPRRLYRTFSRRLRRRGKAPGLWWQPEKVLEWSWEALGKVRV